MRHSTTSSSPSAAQLKGRPTLSILSLPKVRGWSVLSRKERSQERSERMKAQTSAPGELRGEVERLKWVTPLQSVEVMSGVSGSNNWTGVEYAQRRPLAVPSLAASSPTPRSTLLSHSTSSSLIEDSQSDELENYEMVDQQCGYDSGSIEDEDNVLDPWTPSPSPSFSPLTQLPLAYYRSNRIPSTPPIPFPVLFVPTSSFAPMPRSRPQLLDRILKRELLGPASQLPLPYLSGSTNFGSGFASPTFFSSLGPSLTPRPTLDAFLASSPSTIARSLAVQRMSTLGSRSKVWRGHVPCGLDSVPKLRETVLTWLHSYDPTERNPSSPEASYLASVLLSFYWADAPRFSAVTAAVLRRYALTAAVASLTLAIKWLNDFTAPNYAVSLESFARHAPIQISPRQIIDAERSILRTSSLYYAIPTTPYDVLYELERAVTFLGAFKIERPEGWHEIFTAFEEELRRASSSGVTCQSFLAVPPTLLALAALVLAIRSLDTSPPFSQIDFPPSSQLEIVTFLSPLDEEDDEHWDWEKEVVRIEKAVVAGSREVLGLSKVERCVEWLEGLEGE